MPTYTYQCKKCDHELDVFHGIKAKPRVKCDSCGGACRRLIGTGSGIIFKGSGFYETDYKTKKGKPPESDKSEKKKDDASSKKDSSTTSSTKKESGAGKASKKD